MAVRLPMRLARHATAPTFRVARQRVRTRPDVVEQQCRAEWERHLHVVLPVLAIHDFTQRISRAQDDLLQAVAAARAAGISWARIGEAAGLSRHAAQKRWSSQISE